MLRFDDGGCTYLIPCGEGACVIVDPGAGAWWPHLKAAGVDQVRGILLTHLHRDTCGGLVRPGPLADVYAGPVWVPAQDMALAQKTGLSDFWRNVQAAGCPTSYAAPRLPLPQRLHAIGADSELVVGAVRLCAVATPGHTRGALSYLYRLGERQFAFCGDAAHAGATLHELYHLEWDHWTPEGALQAWYGLERLRGNRIDALLPAHGPVVRRDPRRMLGKLQARLMDLIGAKTAIAPGHASRWLDVTPVDGGVSRVLPHLYAVGGNGYVLASDDGHALLFDPQLADLPALERLRAKTGLTIDVATASHYHVDHADGLNEVRSRYGAAVWLHPWVAEPIRDRNRYDVPWLTKDPVEADRLLPEQGRFRWRGYDLGVRPFPGQTWWHCAVDVVVDGQKALISGDNFQPPSRWNGTGGFCAFNGSRFIDGFARSARAALAIDPDLVCNGHRCLYAFDRAHYEAIVDWSNGAQRAVAALCPRSDWLLDYDLRAVRFEPYVVKGAPGMRPTIDLVITNHGRSPLQVAVEPVDADGVRARMQRHRVTVPKGATRRLPVQLTVARAAKRGRHIIAADVMLDGVMHRERCVGLVDVAPARAGRKSR